MSERVTNYLIAGVIAVLAVVAIALPLMRHNARDAAVPEAQAVSTGTTSTVLQISTTPSRVEVLLNGQSRGLSTVAEHHRYRSAPLVLNDLTPGVYELTARREDGTSVTRQVTLQPGDNQFVHVLVWQAESVVKTKDGRRLVGMIVDRTHQHLEIATSAKSVVRLNLEDLVDEKRTLLPNMRPPIPAEQDPVTGDPTYVVDPFPGNLGAKP
jgi:hypothetical protein